MDALLTLWSHSFYIWWIFKNMKDAAWTFWNTAPPRRSKTENVSKPEKNPQSKKQLYNEKKGLD